MFVKLAVLACVATVALGQHWGAQNQHWNAAPQPSPWRNAPIPPGVPAPAQYPAGVDPHSCPNYPNCNNPAIAAGPAGGHGAWNAAPAAPAAPAWNGGHNNALLTGEYTGDGDYRGEGLLESGAFGDVGQWNNGNNNHGGWNGAPAAPAWNAAPAAPAWNAGHGAPAAAATLPAGVDPRSCPNYPFCH